MSLICLGFEICSNSLGERRDPQGNWLGGMALEAFQALEVQECLLSLQDPSVSYQGTCDSS